MPVQNPSILGKEEQMSFDDVTLLTPEGYKQLQEELDVLLTKERQEIAKRIEESREHGEYSEENAELDEVKFRQAIVEERIEELKTILANAQVLTKDDISIKHVGIGSKVTVMNTRSKKESTFIVVSSAEANLDDSYISDESPMGIALIGKTRGDRVTVEAPGGRISYEIKRIGRAVK